MTALGISFEMSDVYVKPPPPAPAFCKAALAAFSAVPSAARASSAFSEAAKLRAAAGSRSMAPRGA